MSVSREPLSGLRMGDVSTFLAVHRQGSLAGAARALKVTSSQVSKAIVRLEKLLHARLIIRGARGVILSEDGQRFAPELAAVLARLRAMGIGDAGDHGELTMAAPSYLVEIALPVLATCQADRVRGIEMPPALLRAYAGENVFDLAVTAGKERLPGGWSSAQIGRMRRGLFASPSLAARLLGRRRSVSVDQLVEVPFIAPVYFTSGQFVPGDDDCPLRRPQRRLGHEAQTLRLALELAAASDQLVYGPVIAARHLLREQRLVEVPVVGWEVRDELFLAANEGRVRARAHRAIIAGLQEQLAHLDM